MAVFRIVYDVENVDDVKAAERAVEDLNEANNKATKSTKELGDESEDASSEMADFSDQAKNAANQVNVFGVGLGDAAEKLGVATKSTKLLTTALKALPLLAVASALASVATFLTSNQRGIDKLRIETARLNATLDVFRDRLAKVGESLFNVFTQVGKNDNALSAYNKTFVRGTPVVVGFRIALEALKKAFPGLTEEITEESEEAAKLEERLIALERIERGFAVSRAQANKEIEQAKLLAEDQSESLEVRAAAAEKALALESQALENQLKTQRLLISTLEDQIKLASSTDEDFIMLEQARIRLADLESTSITRSIELNNKLNTIRQQQFDQEVKTAELRIENREADLDGIDTETEKQLEADLKVAQQRRDLFVEQEAIRIANKKREDQFRLQRIEAEREAANEILAITTGFLAANSDLAKGLAVFNAIINTREAITKALASVPPPTSFVLAGLVAARGFAEVTSILSQQRPNVQPPKFAEGVIDLEGPGTATSDSIPAYLSRGESVMTAKETQDFLPTLKAIRKGQIDPSLLNGVVNDGPTVIDASKVIEVPRDHISFDEDGFTARIANGVSRTIMKGNRFNV